MIAINIITITPKDVGMAIPMFAHEEKEAQGKTNHWLNPVWQPEGDSSQAAWLQPHLSLPMICLSYHSLFGDRLGWQPRTWQGWADCWLAIFLFFHLGRTESTTERHLERFWLFWSCDTGRDLDFYFVSAGARPVENALLILRPWCGYAKLSPGFISVKRSSKDCNSYAVVGSF